MFTASSPMYIRWARSIETTTRDSEISFTVVVLGTSTSIPDCRIGAVIMKITKRTSMTSTKGTMLMSERELLVWRDSCGIFGYLSGGVLVSPKEKFTSTLVGVVHTATSAGRGKVFR